MEPGTAARSIGKPSYSLFCRIQSPLQEEKLETHQGLTPTIACQVRRNKRLSLWIGIGNPMLSLTDEALALYEEILNYWSSPYSIQLNYLPCLSLLGYENTTKFPEESKLPYSY